MLVYLNSKTVAMLVYPNNPLGIELYYHANVFFCFGRKTTRVGSYLLLNTIIHLLYNVLLPIVFCAKCIVLLANPEARSMRYDMTRKTGLLVT